MSIGFISVSQCPSIYQRDSWHLLISINQLFNGNLHRSVWMFPKVLKYKSRKYCYVPFPVCVLSHKYTAFTTIQTQNFPCNFSMFLLRVCLIPTGVLHKVLMVLNFTSYVDWDTGILYYCWDSNNHSIVADYLIKVSTFLNVWCLTENGTKKSLGFI